MFPKLCAQGSHEQCTVGVPWTNQIFYYGVVAVDINGNRDLTFFSKKNLFMSEIFCTGYFIKKVLFNEFFYADDNCLGWKMSSVAIETFVMELKCYTN